MDRTELSRALAKAIAYKACGKDHEAAIWAAKLLGLLECAHIINPSFHELRNAAVMAGIKGTAQ